VERTSNGCALADAAETGAATATETVLLRPVARVSNGGLFAVKPVLAAPVAEGIDRIDRLLGGGVDSARTAACLERIVLAAVDAYATEAFPSSTRLLLPYAPAFLDRPETTLTALLGHARVAGVNGNNLVLDLHLGDSRPDGEGLSRLAQEAEHLGLRVCLAGFGAGHANADILRVLKPRYVTLHPDLIKRAHHSATDKKLLRGVIELGLAVGAHIIVSGIDTPAALYAARDLGIEFAYGDLIGRPEEEGDGQINEAAYDILTRKRKRRSEIDDADMIRDQIYKIEALEVTQPVQGLFEIFRRHKDKSVVPIVDAEGVPLGIVREPTIKDYIYSKFGRDLLSNTSYQRTIHSFMSPCPVVPLNSTAEKVLDAYSRIEAADGVLVTENGRYFGFLSASALLHIINEKNLQFARDQNPLTRLPGNRAIEHFIEEATELLNRRTTFVYFDLDNFKPFNDVYGFRQGDRVLVLLSEILKKAVPPGTFIGHIGGDDFFIGLRDLDCADSERAVADIQDQFSEEVKSFYGDDHREHGFITAKDRYGADRQFPLMTVSAALLHLADRRDETSVEALFQIVGALKKQAKAASTHRATFSTGQAGRAGPAET